MIKVTSFGDLQHQESAKTTLLEMFNFSANSSLGIPVRTTTPQRKAELSHTIRPSVFLDLHNLTMLQN